MSKLLWSFIGIMTLSVTSLSFADELIFPPSSTPSHNASTNSRTPLTPEQFKAKVEARGEASRQAITQNAMQAIDQMQQTSPSENKPQQPMPSNNNHYPQAPQPPANHHQTATPPPPSSNQVYTGFPSDANSDTTPSGNINTNGGSNWNIKY